MSASDRGSEGPVQFTTGVSGEIRHPANAELPSLRLTFERGGAVRVAIRTGDQPTKVGEGDVIKVSAVTQGVDLEIMANAAIINVTSRDGVPCAAFCQTKPETELPPKPYTEEENVGVVASPGYLAPEANTAAGGDSVVYVIVGEGSYKNGEIPPRSKALRVERTTNPKGNTLVTTEVPLNEALERADTGLGGGSLVKIKTKDGVSLEGYVVVPQKKSDGSMGPVGDNGVVLLYEKGNEEHTIRRHRTRVVLAG